MRSRNRPRIGISACLLGDRVRYDGGHKRDALLLELLGQHVEWVPVCPEVEVGMGTPREPLHLVQHASGLRMISSETRTDYTDAMNAWAERRLDDLSRQVISGYILKKNSPSCGKDHVKVYSNEGLFSQSGRGLFAAALMRRFPGLPIEEEDSLHDIAAIQNFLERVRAFDGGRAHAPAP